MLPLRYISRVSFAARGGSGRNDNRLRRGAKEFEYNFSDPTDSGLNNTIATPKRRISRVQETSRFVHVNALKRRSGGNKSAGFMPVAAARQTIPAQRMRTRSQNTRLDQVKIVERKKTEQRPKRNESDRVRRRSRALVRGTPMNGEARMNPRPKGNTHRKK
jgi:hypothetical protein